ncbi:MULTISPECIES: hypothetical protein [Protofrankia]|uniref:hypothetical protein n=1 Tax=Protofrankia TaxID=2994361 RepID=UPI000A434610|nr:MULTISPECIES: hypothetical protein [Protofrankia]
MTPGADVPATVMALALFWLSRLGNDSGYATGILVPIILLDRIRSCERALPPPATCSRSCPPATVRATRIRPAVTVTAGRTAVCSSLCSCW